MGIIFSSIQIHVRLGFVVTIALLQIKGYGRNSRSVALLKSLKETDPVKGASAEALYNQTIDFGAHPNEKALTQTP